jgi:xylitol oxidase
LYAATSLEQVRDYVKKEKKLKVLGTRHCFNNIADSKDSFLSLKPMNEVIAIDVAKHTVTVAGGITYGLLCPYLDGKGFALHNLASLPHISVAGACSTATHGSGEKNGNLATAVSGLEMVTASGDVLTLSREHDAETFSGAVVGLGALGVITKVTLDMQPRFLMRQYVYENLPLSQLKDHFDEIESSAYSVSLFTDWQKQRINEVWIKSRVEEGQAFRATPECFGARLATRNLHPIAELSAENCTEQMGVPGPWYERLPHFRMGFVPSAGKELQSEYFVPRQHAVEAILAVERLRDQVSPQLLISEIRSIAADQLWLSPCYQQPCVTIHFTWKQNWPAVRKLMPIIEKELAPFHARPHWGKLFTTSPAQLQVIYKKMPEFVELSRKYDPQGKFRNEYLNKNVFAN